jgi:hypothetical protein
MKTIDMSKAWDDQYRSKYGKKSWGGGYETPPQPKMSEEANKRLALFRNDQDKIQEILKSETSPREIGGVLVLPVQGLDGYPELVPMRLAENFQAITWKDWEDFEEVQAEF